MKTKTKKTEPKPKPVTKCRAAEVGHRRCHCGSSYCGARIHEP